MVNANKKEFLEWVKKNNDPQILKKVEKSLDSIENPDETQCKQALRTARNEFCNEIYAPIQDCVRRINKNIKIHSVKNSQLL